MYYIRSNKPDNKSCFRSDNICLQKIRGTSKHKAQYQRDSKVWQRVQVVVLRPPNEGRKLLSEHSVSYVDE